MKKYAEYHDAATMHARMMYVIENERPYCFTSRLRDWLIMTIEDNC